jgi:hypothetical protein
MGVHAAGAHDGNVVVDQVPFALVAACMQVDVLTPAIVKPGLHVNIATAPTPSVGGLTTTVPFSGSDIAGHVAFTHVGKTASDHAPSASVRSWMQMDMFVPSSANPGLHVNVATVPTSSELEFSLTRPFMGSAIVGHVAGTHAGRLAGDQVPFALVAVCTQVDVLLPSSANPWVQLKFATVPTTRLGVVELKLTAPFLG